MSVVGEAISQISSSKLKERKCESLLVLQMSKTVEPILD